MTTANLSTAQALVKTCLLKSTAFEGLDIFLELDEAADATQLEKFEEQFETALATKGVAVVVLCPEIATVDKADFSAVSGKLGVAVAICENPAVNRGAADATALPRRSPANKSARLLVEAAIAALLPEFDFPPQPAGRPTWDEGFWAYYLVAQKRHTIRAASTS